MNWKPIKDAPQDGKELVVTDFASPPQFASWEKSHLYTEGGYRKNRNGRSRELPTHFLELPPKAATGG